MELMELAQRTAELIAPVLPFLNTATGELLEKAKEHIQEDVLKRAGTVIKKLLPFLQEKEESKRLVEDVAADPQNSTCRGALAYEVLNLFRNNEGLARDIAGEVSAPSISVRDVHQTAGDNAQQLGVIGSVHIHK